MASISLISLNWLQLLEKEFDLSFVDCDTSLANVFALLSDTEDNGFNGSQLNDMLTNICDARQHLTAISAVFAQLVHKSVTIANHNENLARELTELRNDLVEAHVENSDHRLQIEELSKTIDQISKTKNMSANNGTERNSFEILRAKDVCDMNGFAVRKQLNQAEMRNEECNQLRKENISLRRQIVQLQSELFGSRLAAKYLDKELAGRIQQIQLLGRDIKDNDHDRLWNQLEAEIHLHRHKTVIRACRGHYIPGQELPAPPDHDYSTLKRSQGIGNIRLVTVDKDENEGLGLSITGGKEHGVPIIISQLHANSAASRTGALYVGDAILSVNSIDLRETKHSDAAYILSSQKGKCVLEVIFVTAEEHSDDESVSAVDECEASNLGLTTTRSRYPFYDSSVIDVNALTLADCYETTNDSESQDDNPDINDTVISLSSSPAKRYPGVAKLSFPSNQSINDNNNDYESDSICEPINSGNNNNSIKSKETVIN